MCECGVREVYDRRPRIARVLNATDMNFWNGLLLFLYYLCGKKQKTKQNKTNRKRDRGVKMERRSYQNETGKKKLSTKIRTFKITYNVYTHSTGVYALCVRGKIPFRYQVITCDFTVNYKYTYFMTKYSRLRYPF